MGLSKHRTNHNIGVRATYLRCSIAACLYRCRLLENLNFVGDIPQSRQRAQSPGGNCPREGTHSVINLSIERGQAAPKKVFNFKLLFVSGGQRVKRFVTN